MAEEFIKEQKVIDKTEDEKELELIISILKTKQDLKQYIIQKMKQK